MKPLASLLLTLALITLITISCSQKETVIKQIEPEEVILGELQHGFNLNPLTQENFEKGLLLLHNFEYDDALVAFEEATALDSTEVMTHWGEAMCHYKALWKLQNTEKGRAILSRLGKTKEDRLASIEDPAKKVMWEIVEIMFGEGEFKERNKMLVEHLASSHKRYPKHQEIATFYALSLIWATEKYGDGSDDLRLSASIADKVIKMNPLHPGALHYKIHALDGPTSAKDAQAAANAYAKVATDAAHALHMPSHIYLALGNWEGVVNSNKVSYDASVNRVKSQKLEDGKRGHHSLAWLHYGLLQQGRYTEAEDVLNEIITYAPNDPTKGARVYLLGMQSRQLAENGSVSTKTPIDIDIKVDDIGLASQSGRSFLRAQLAYGQKDTVTMNEEIKWLSQKIVIAAQDVKGDGIAMCAAGTSRYAPTENAINSAKVIIAQIQGMKAQLASDSRKFETYMQAAIELEDQTNYPTGPPRIPKPSFEQYGEWLLAEGNYTEAHKQFDKALKRMPNRTKSLLGKMKALTGMDQKQEAQKIESALKTIWEKADNKALISLSE